MPAYNYISHQQVPAARLLVAFIGGILLQWYAGITILPIEITGIITGILAVCFYFLPRYKKFSLRWLQGVLIMLLFTVAGALLTYTNNVQHQPQWFQNNHTKNTILIATVDEPLIAKPNSYKALIKITAVQNDRSVQQATGHILVYFKKDTAISRRIGYGSQIAFSKPVQPIQNTGNPGGFNYQRYLLFQDVTAQVYLQAKDYVVLPQNNGSSFQIFLQRTRTFVINVLQQYIPGKKEQGVAEALLIGYRNDLDKQLVQSYSRTGVVHIIAISGLHLGMIYALLLFIFSPFKNKKWYSWVMPVTVLTILWLFTLIAGAVPSIARSAVMFSFIVLGNLLGKKGNIYNTLAISALCLLIYNPFYLWDVGFQLSYAAVFSIIVFVKPIYNLLYFNNKIINKIWLLVSTNIAAQIFTLPIVLFYFHQFPLLFLISNLLVVPLSTLILFIEIFIVAITSISWLAALTGKLCGWLLWVMNSFIEQIEKLPFSVWQNIKTDVVQAITLYIIILLLIRWLFAKSSTAFLCALGAVLIFAVYTAADVYTAKQQHKLVVYNVPKATAIDVVDGGSCRAILSSSVVQDALLQNFYLQPTRLLNRAFPLQINALTANNYLLHIAGKSVLIVGKTLPHTNNLSQRLSADAVIITGNPKLYIGQLCVLVKSPVIVCDASNMPWKIEKWKKDCDSLHLRFHSVAQDGAFIMNL